ncbi:MULTISPECIES: FAD binding domain-containing protein [Psychrilyobacter]|uniref:FAD-binding protein n=1 Tax=Psychrilyobacter piezotolerans TaxID=2293438 RepID=A0ABX9KHT5_9FUSO|nr:MULTISPECIES: FAD binding domain-containing protein [Psychrilyobacter]MCS5421833.1 FAD binding domain-containing protein [Psychrilyobacter sp. S5]NDI77569.1 FAD-binding protein [Psychrilyobacter piezotolerans]RDE62921.1 FAD-binding protein [Psychrilyobacter sp. S5]REI41679.1 FAD-binding protein [Psychrilyobacter piezotolerans]
MFTIKQHLMAQSIEEGYETLVKNRNNVILGGTGFLKLGNKNINIGIDLSDLDLDYIREDENNIEIGPMTTFRSVETNKLLRENFDGIIAKSVEEIVGIQLRSVITAGATVASKYGFSDFITALLSLNTQVELYKGGIISLDEYLAEEKIPRDILVRIIIKKDGKRAAFKTMRNSKSDYAVLNCAVSDLDGEYRVAVGARPGRAVVKTISNEEVNNKIDEKIEAVVNEMKFGKNMRASGEYREMIAKVLIRRCLEELESK